MQAFGGMMEAQGQYASQRDAVNASNQSAYNDYMYRRQMQDFERKRATQRYQIAVQQYEQTKQAEYEALGKNYNALQRQLDNSYRSAFEAEQNESMMLAQSLGKGSTRGLSGKTAARMDNAAYAQRGRNLAIRQANLLEAGYGYKDKAEKERINSYSRVRQAYAPVSQGVQFGPSAPAPVYQSQPNRLGLYSGMINAGVGGFQTASSLAPESNFLNLFRGPKG